VKELKRKTPTSAFIAVNCGGENDHVWTKHLLDKGDWDCSSFINNQKLGLSQLSYILRLNVLDCLSVIFKDIYAHNGVVKFWVCRLQNVVVRVLPIVQRV
jgi:hypothetical protein